MIRYCRLLSLAAVDCANATFSFGVSYDQECTMQLRLSARGDERGAGASGSVSLHGLPTPQWFGFWRRLLFPERSGARRGSKQGLRAHRRFGAKGRTAFLPQLRLYRVLVRGSIPAPCRHLLWGIRRSFDALAPCIRVGDHAASLGDFRSQSCSLSGSTLARRTARRADGQPE